MEIVANSFVALVAAACSGVSGLLLIVLGFGLWLLPAALAMRILVARVAAFRPGYSAAVAALQVGAMSWMLLALPLLYVFQWIYQGKPMLACIAMELLVLATSMVLAVAFGMRWCIDLPGGARLPYMRAVSLAILPSALLFVFLPFLALAFSPLWSMLR